VADEPITVRGALEKHFRLSASSVAELFALGAIYLNKRRVLADAKLSKGAYLRIHLQPKRFPVDRIDWRAVVVREEREFLVVNKPAGIPVHATLDNARDNVLHQLRERTGLRLLVTQRLDVPVAGLLVLAKTPEFQRRFNQWLVDRKVVKHYRALTEGRPPAGLCVHYMEPSERSPRRVSQDPAPGWARCELTVHSASDLGGLFDVAIQLHTGRTHQIRAQLSALGCPVLGDRLYGARNRVPDAWGGGVGIALFASGLSWPAPGSKAWEFELVPPWALAGFEGG
jgi:23S rRNA pseudouridine1911/1915/1917 synthase